MTENELETFDPALRALLDEVEPRECAIDDALRDRMRARLEVVLAAAAPAPSEASPAPPTPGIFRRILPMVASAALGAGVATMVLNALREPQIVYVDRPLPSVVADAANVPPVVIAPTAAAPAPSAVAPAPTGQPPRWAATSTAASSPLVQDAARGDDPLVVETRLIDTARAALAHGDANAAMTAIGLHAARYPDGRLAEEREALAVQALASAGRRDEAEARAARFHRRYPTSLLGGVVDLALTSIP